jgi:hypothetical protein
MTNKEAIQSLEYAIKILEYGCYDRNCVINTKHKGQVTNGGCRCKASIVDSLNFVAQKIMEPDFKVEK